MTKLNNPAKAGDPHAYTIVVRRVVEDGQSLFRATVQELPDVIEYAAEFKEAYGLVIDAIQTLAETAAKEGRQFPLPAAEESMASGRVTLRLGRTLHQKAALQARLDNVSLNQCLVELVAHGLGAKATRRFDASFSLLLATTSSYGERIREQLKRHVGVTGVSTIRARYPTPYGKELDSEKQVGTAGAPVIVSGFDMVTTLDTKQ
jgi:predicted HicB family RNase H-like nuclease